MKRSYKTLTLSKMGSGRRTLILLLALILALSAVTMPYVFADGEDEGEKMEPKNGITKISDLNGKTIGVQTGVLYEDEIKDEIENETWLYYKMPNDMIAALEANKIDAYLIEEVGFYAQHYEHPELMRLEEKAGQSEFAVIIGNNEKQDTLYKQMQEFIAEGKKSGWLDKLYDYWVKNWNPNTCKIEIKPMTTGENGTVIIAIEGGYEPFSFETANGVSGYDVEFMMNFCAKYGYQWDFWTMEFDSIAPGAISGKYDFGMNIVVDEERAEDSVLTDWYYVCDLVFVVEGEYESEMGFFERMAYNFNKTFIREDRWKLFAEGMGRTMLITVLSIVLGTLLGFAAYMACRHGNKIANGITGVINWLIEGIPTVVFLMILAFIVFGKSTLSATWISIIGFTFTFGCGMFEMLKVGFGAIHKGQFEAATAMGYSDTQSFFRILLPQAAQHFLPIYKSNVVSLIKETSVVGYIAVRDLTKMGDLVRSRTYVAFFGLIAVAILYFVMEAVLVFIVKRVQIKIDPRRRSKEKILEGIKEAE